MEKVNAQAPGNNVNLREIEIFGSMPSGSEEPSYTVRGSELERGIAKDGTQPLEHQRPGRDPAGHGERRGEKCGGNGLESDRQLPQRVVPGRR